MTESEYLDLRELAWRRELTEDEKSSLQAYLLIHPEVQQDWDQEILLNQALAAIPNSPLSSNFTAQVLEAVYLEERQHRSGTAMPWLARLRLWLPRVAVATLVVGLGGLGYQQHRLHSLQEKVKSVGMVTDLATALPSVQMWQDFDAIANLAQPQPHTPSQDEILWAALESSDKP